MHTLSLKLTGRPAAGLQTAVGTSPPAMWDSDDLTLRLWFDAGTRTNGVNDPYDVATITTLTLEMRETPETSAMLIAAKTTSTFAACTLADFIDDDGEHATIALTDTETNVVGTMDQVWLSLVGTLSDGSRYTFGAGYVAIIHSGADQSALVDPVDTYAQNAFKTISIAGQSSVVADSPTDTLTLVAGSGITLTTNASTDTITVTSTGGGVVSVDNRISRGDGTTAVQSSGWTINDDDEISVTLPTGKTALSITCDDASFPLSITTNGETARVSLDPSYGSLDYYLPQQQGFIAALGDVQDLETEVLEDIEALKNVRYSPGDYIDELILGLTASTTTKNIYSTYDHVTPSYVRGTQCWAYPIDLTCVSVYNNSTADLWRHTCTAITPRHVLMSSHADADVGSTVRFVTAAGAVESRTISAVAAVGAADMKVGLLSSQLPATITPAWLIPTDVNRSIDVEGMACFMVNRSEEAVVHEASRIIGGVYYNRSTTAPADGQRAAFWEGVADGDSGRPWLSSIDGMTIVLGIVSTTSQGPAPTHQYYDDIIAAIETLGAYGHAPRIAPIDASANNAVTEQAPTLITEAIEAERITPRTLESVRLSFNTTIEGSPTMELGGDATGDLYYNDGGFMVPLAIGATNRLLTVAGGIPTWSQNISVGGTLGVTGPTTLTGALTANANGADSAPAVNITGVPFAGTGTTSFPLVYINETGATASTTLSTAGTLFGVNGNGTSDLMNLLKDGVSQFNVSSTGSATAKSSLIAGVALYVGGTASGTSSIVQSNGAGILQITNFNGTDFNRLQFGGTTSSFPAIKRNATAINIRLADDSADAPLTASNLTASGTLAVTGATTLTGLLTANGAVIATPQALSGPGAVNVTTLSTKLTTTGTGDALTLADGTNGQLKTIVYAAEGAGADTAVLAPTTKTGYTTITFTAIGNAVTLQFFTTQGWMVVSNYGCTIA